MRQVRVKIIDMDTDLTQEQSYEVDDGTIENLALKGSIKLSYEGSDDKYQALMTSSLTFDLLDNTGEDGSFFHLYTGAEDRYRVNLTDEDDNLLWQGFLLPDQFSEPYKYPTLFVSMTATDCVGILKGKDFGDRYYSQEHSIIDYICTALRSTGIIQELYLSPSIEPTNGFMWHEIFVDGRAYASEVKTSEVEFLPSQEVDSIYDVLERIVADLGCKLFSWRGKWYMIGINQQHKDVVECYRYSSEGLYLGKINIEQEVKPIVFYVDPMITVVSPWRTVELSAELDEDNSFINEDYLVNKKSLISIIPGLDEWIPNPMWKFIGAANFGPVPKDGKFVGVWKNPGQLLPDINYTDPTHIGVSGYRSESNVRGSYMELKDPIWLEGPDNIFQFKLIDFELELVAYSRLSTKERYENNEFANVLRYEVLLGNEVLWSNFPKDPTYVRDSLELSYSDESVQFSDKVYYNENFIEQRKSLKGKMTKEGVRLTKSGWLQVRIYPPVLVDTREPTFQIVGVQNIKFKVTSKKNYEVKKVRYDLRYSTKKAVELFHIDNAQDNSYKSFLFRREGVKEQRSWRQSWKRSGINESIRFGDAYAKLVHDVQPGIHIKIDGDAEGIYEPNQLLAFSWRGNKKFIPTRIEMNFSEAKTSLTVIENVYESLFLDGPGIFG